MAPSDKKLEAELRNAVREVARKNREDLTVNNVRKLVEEKLALVHGFFSSEKWKARSKTLIKTVAPASSPVKKKQEDTPVKKAIKRQSPESSPAPKRRKNAAALPEESDDDANVEEHPSPKKKLAVRRRGRQVAESDEEPDRPAKSKPVRGRKATNGRSRNVEEDEESAGDELNGSAEGDCEPAPVSKPRKKRKAEPAPKKQAPKRRKAVSEDEEEDEEEAEAEAEPTEESSPQPDLVDESSELSDVLDVPPEPKSEKGTPPAGKSSKPLQANDASAPDKVNDSPAAGEGEPKPSIEDESSELSDVIDEPPKPKRGKKQSVTAPTAATTWSRGKRGGSSSHPERERPDDAEVKKLQSQLVKCGVRKIWGIELKQYGDDARAKVRHLKDMLRDIGMPGRFSEAKAREIKERRELEADLEAVTAMNVTWGASDSRGGRPTRGRGRLKKVPKEPSSDENDGEAVEEGKNARKVGDGDGSDDNEDEDEAPAVSAKARGRSRAQADLAFLGDDDEDSD
ncbi:hypothetical protein SODALDRAFT_279031 [Sodiomyces alkalinus F11]|uniref:Transcriptional regulator n=1 Tax=Sodiomyces alkalinus (strain CBS 110278 / VKM F-3762 / F11) TaxID=1314773 RepID=A0A3N2PTY0_SODAK|nr:hypothetical protein SODALDRAFT_279031 [Sodiomyces alkalinus F11]ROT37958.1 hypothetical protein SODALDRAFT_279031 [Sodiomyces alkalinus F11]